MRPSTKVKIAAIAGSAAVLAGLTVGLPRLSAWMRRGGNGLSVAESDYFEVHAADAAGAADLGRKADRFVREMAGQYASLGFVVPQDPVPVYLFPAHEDFARHARFRTGSGLENNGGYFSPAEMAIALVGTDETALRHELTHLLAHVAWPGADLTPWFSEGHAQWHEAGPRGGIPVVALAACRHLYADRPLPPIDLLVELDRGAFTAAGNSDAYALVAILYSWLATERPEALARITRLELQPGTPSAQQFSAALKEDLEGARNDWERWFRNLWF